MQSAPAIRPAAPGHSGQAVHIGPREQRQRWHLVRRIDLPLFSGLGQPSCLRLVEVAADVAQREHLLVFPGGGVGNAMAGFWPDESAAYVEYTLPVSRPRFIAVTLAPVLLLSVGVLIVAAIGVRVPMPVRWASVLNAVGSGADLLVVFLVLR